MTATEVATLIGIATTSILAIIAAIFGGIASLRAGRAAVSAQRAEATVAKVEAVVADPVSGLKAVHDLSNSNFSDLAADRDRERAAKKAQEETVARLHQAATDLAALAKSEADIREAAYREAAKSSPAAVVNVEIKDPAIVKDETGEPEIADPEIVQKDTP